MELLLPSTLPPILPARRCPLHPSAIRFPISTYNRKRRTSPLSLSAAIAAAAGTQEDFERKKHDLLHAVQDTQRGLAATPEQRAAIEEALVCVEACGADSAVDLSRLDGTWRLNYTSASDVLVLFEAAARIPFFEVWQVFQKFECRGGGRRRDRPECRALERAQLSGGARWCNISGLCQIFIAFKAQHISSI